MSTWRCNKCDTAWGGVKTCHCCRRGGGCGYNFTTPGNFDEHRKSGSCVLPTRMRPPLIQLREGVYGLSTETPYPGKGHPE